MDFSGLTRDYAHLNDAKQSEGMLANRLLLNSELSQASETTKAKLKISALEEHCNQSIAEFNLTQDWEMRKLEVRQNELLEILTECEDKLRLFLNKNKDASELFVPSALVEELWQASAEDALVGIKQLLMLQLPPTKQS